MNGRPWHVLHVLSNHEKRVARRLAARSVEHYLPLYTERVNWTDRTVVTERPLFSGYVFARITNQSRISVISTPGVLQMLGDGDRDLVSEDELARIRDGLASGLLLRPHSSVAVGTRVRVRDGIFAGIEGVVTELRKQCRVIITFTPVSQCFSLEVGIESLVVPTQAAAKPKQHAAPAYDYSFPV
jgi:transcription antitermination factor NusG